MNLHTEPRTTRHPTRIGLFAVAALAAGLAGPARAADGATIVPFSTAKPGDPPVGWKFATLPNKSPTRFSVVELNGTHVLKAEADNSYGNLVHSMRVSASERSTLAWRWRTDKLVEEADLKSKSGDDGAAKLCVFFAFDIANLSFGERTKLALAKSVTGEEVPTETLCYVWDNKLAPETTLINAFSPRIRMIVLESGAKNLGQWVSHKRNLGADYQRMFGDESGGKFPDITGVAVQADADNTHGKGLSYFGDIVLVP